MSGEKVSGDWEDSDRGGGNKASTRAGNPPKKKSPTYIAYIKNKKGRHPRDQKELERAQEYIKKNPNFGKVSEAKVDQGRSDYGKASIRNYRRSGPGHGEPAMFDPENKRGKLIDKRREEHKARRGVKGAKVPAYKVSEDKAFDFVKNKLKAKYGDGVLTTGEKIKPQSAADKAKARAHQAKVDAENAAERAKDPSQGRYPKG